MIYFCFQHFENVTVLFSDVVGFTKICSKITPMGVMEMLNDLYTSFDTLSEEKKVYKVLARIIPLLVSSSKVLVRTSVHEIKVMTCN